MIIRYAKAVDQDNPGKDSKTAGEQAGEGHDENCRCREASRMTPQELLKLMMSDLAFWKKPKKG